MFDHKDKMVIRQDMMTMFGWERPHKSKGYKAWTYSEMLGMADKYKFDDFFMTMMQKLVKGTAVGKAWLKERKNFIKISQAKVIC